MLRIPFTKRLHGSLTKISDGFLRSFKRNGIFLTVQSMLPFPNCVFSLFTFFISPGMTHSFLCVSLIPICPLFLQKMRPKSLFLPCQTSSRRLWLLSCILPAFALVKSATSVMKTSSGKICASISHTVKTALTVLPFFPNRRLTFLPSTGLPVEDPPATFFHNREILQNPLIPFISPDTSKNMRWNSDGLNASPAILSGMLLEHISTKMVLIL